MKDHPVILRLVQLRVYMEKLRPIEKKLTYQMDKLLALARSGGLRAPAAEDGQAVAADALREDDLLQFKPRPGSLAKREQGGKGTSSATPGIDSLEREEGDGIYRPPRLNPVAMDDDPDVRSRRRQEERRGQEKVRDGGFPPPSLSRSNNTSTREPPSPLLLHGRIAPLSSDVSACLHTRQSFLPCC